MQGNNLDNPEQNTGQIFNSQNRQNTQENGEALSASESQNRQAIFAGTSKSQKIAVILLAFFAVFIVVMWFISFQNSLKSPFQYQAGGSDQVAQGQGSEAEREAQLKVQDTDGDGLSDWDELNVYQTSPYLEDSDSDGFSDKEEISSDNDPNCPQGVDCYGSGLLDAGVKKEVDTGVTMDDLNAQSSIIGQMMASQPESDNNIATQDTAVLEQLMSGNIDAQTLRQLLLEYGMDEAVLNQFSDAELLKNFQETIAEQQ
ncbi:MAG: hypothetical protein U9R06_02020 [Patescibacteria group bacterium]|nr:hypothetical protein [Patescibacteria group bacterium]